MIGVTIIALGKLKEKYMREFSEEYQKRLSAYCKLNIVELSTKMLSDIQGVSNFLGRQISQVIF